jgi:tripartite ATP-independent transporter DctM subunit
MKRTTKIIAATAVAIGLSAQAFAEELKFASFVPPFHTVTASMIDKLGADLAAATGGALTIRNYPGGELGKGPVEQYVRALQGVADMSWGLQGYTSSQFPKSMVIELPGVVNAGMFILTITALCWWREDFGPAGPRTTMIEKLRAFAGATPIVGVIFLSIGGIYGGIFSPVEAAAVGAGAVVLIGFVGRTLSLAALWSAARDSVVTTATVMLILIAAHMINPFLALSHIPDAVGDLLGMLNLSVYGTFGVILLIYLVLGCFLEGFAMLVLTLPIFFPIITSLGIDPIWFGVLVVLTLEMGLISPPVGINVFIVKSVAPNVPLGQIFQGVLPFWAMMIVALGLLVAFPQIALILPNTMFD